MLKGLPLTRRQLLASMAATGLTVGLYPKMALSADGKILRVRAYTDIQNIDPAFRTGSPEDDVMKCILPGLVSVKAGDEWGWQLDCARKDQAGRSDACRIHAHDGLMWSDGFGPVTADDVKFSYERVADPKMESPYKDDWHALDHVEVKDDRSGVIVLKEPFAPLWFTTLLFGTGRIVSRKAVESVGGKYDTKPPAQCGPYMLKEWLPKQKLTLARNPDWKGDAAGVGRDPDHADRRREGRRTRLRERRPRLHLGRGRARSRATRRRRRRTASSSSSRRSPMSGSA